MKLSEEKLTLALAREGLAYKDLCEQAGISENALRSIRRGETQPRTVTIHKIAKTLKVPVEDLIEKEGERNE